MIYMDIYKYSAYITLKYITLKNGKKRGRRIDNLIL